MSGAGSGIVVLGVLAALVCLCGGVAVWALRSEQRLRARLARMKGTNTSRIADAAPGTIVEVAGVARETADAGTLEAPLGGQACLFFRVAIKESNGSAIHHVATHTDAVDFLLDDGSGAIARVATKNAAVGLLQKSIVPAEEGRAALLLAELGIRKSMKDLLWFEETIEPGAELYVLGEARAVTEKEKSGSNEAAFREGARPRVTIAAPDEGELVISVGDEAELAAALREEMATAGKIGKGFALVTLLVGGFVGWLFLSFLSS